MKVSKLSMSLVIFGQLSTFFNMATSWFVSLRTIDLLKSLSFEFELALELEEFEVYAFDFVFEFKLKDFTSLLGLPLSRGDLSSSLLLS
jgi:hypothetical protein